MIALQSAPVQTIQRTLAIGFSILIVLLIAAGGVGWVSMAGLSRDVVDTFSHANEVTRQASLFSHVITREVQAAATYLSDDDPAADGALATIVAAAERTRTAAASVSSAAEENVHAVEGAARNLGLVAKTAESHATAAMQVSASTEEQSAACEQMTSASTQLLLGSRQLRGLVGELRTAAA